MATEQKKTHYIKLIDDHLVSWRHKKSEKIRFLFTIKTNRTATNPSNRSIWNQIKRTQKENTDGRSIR